MSRLQCLLSVSGSAFGTGRQEWSEQPKYQEVNPGGQVVMPCIVLNKKGECRWERDGNPVGIYPGKYEWAGVSKNSDNAALDDGDCSLRILDANLEYDDGVWQCQVTPSSFNTRDALISEGAELVVRGEFGNPNTHVVTLEGQPCQL